MRTTLPITRYQVGRLQIEAGAAGDTAMVTACKSALASDVWPPTNAIRLSAYRDCERAIRDAAAQDESDASWDYEGYWNTVLGVTDAAGVVEQYELSGPRSAIDEWLGRAESDAWAEGAQGGEMPKEWSTFHESALDALEAAL
jgi:hypothetical protein